MFISHRYKVIFIHIQRTGGNSIHRVFEEYDPDFQYRLPLDPLQKRLKHPFASDIKAVTDAGIFQNYIKFCVVRNPFDRMVSWYSMFKHKNTEKKNIPNEFAAVKTVGDAVEAAVAGNLASLEDFLKLSKEDPDGLLVRFHTPQLAFITGDRGQVLVDRILRFENLAEEFKAFSRDICFDGQLPHTNTSIRRQDYRGYYSEEMKQEMLFRFREDFEYFGYDF